MKFEKCKLNGFGYLCEVDGEMDGEMDGELDDEGHKSTNVSLLPAIRFL